MNRGLLAAVAALSICAPAQAVIVQFQGTVEQQFGDDSALVQIGDTVTISFDFDPATQLIDPIHESGDYWFPKNTPSNVFSIQTSRGLLWTATDEILDEGVFLSYGQGEPEFHGHSFTEAGMLAPEFLYLGDTFQITVPAESGAALRFAASSAESGVSQFRGSISYVSGAPEPASWALMFLGFGAVGFSARQRFARLATPLPA